MSYKIYARHHCLFFYHRGRKKNFDATVGNKFFFFFFIDRHLALIFYYFFLYTVFVCKFRPQESHLCLGDLRRMISLVVGPYFDMPNLLLPGLEPATLERQLC